jgi:SAM-dependent methyltransferase
MPSQKPAYGIDAPIVISAFLFFGALALIWCLYITVMTKSAQGVGLLVPAILFGGLGIYMLRWSLVDKVRGRQAMLDRVPWTGNEVVLDVGCGRGLMLLAAAQRTPAGKGVGIDLWHNQDQAGNRPDATRSNARLEGVSDRVALVTADMRTLPFADASFDCVVSHWAVHNLSLREDRSRAIDEMIRVLKPDGYILLADIQHHKEYLSRLTFNRLRDVRNALNRRRDVILAVLTLGCFRPALAIARKPDNTAT